VKILLVYPGQICSTFDVALGYHEALTALGHQVYPYNFHDWINYHEGALTYWSKANPNFNFSEDEVSDAWYRLASGHLITNAVEFQPDVILIVHGLLLHPSTFDLLNKLGIPKAIILTECPYIDATQMRMLKAAQFDQIFVNDRISVEAIDGQVTYLPHSYSRLRHRPGRVDPDYATDVYFHGTWFDERAEMFGELERRNGHDIHIVGVGWEDGIGNAQVGSPNSELIKHYQSAKIALNHHRTTTIIGSNEQIQGESLGPRAYEIAACGAFQLCDDTRPELKEVFGDSVAIYHDPDDLCSKVNYYLSHEQERWEMAQEALKRVAPCSFINRAEQILLPAIMEKLNVA
jgi:spore maturation protein CgeB